MTRIGPALALALLATPSASGCGGSRSSDGSTAAAAVSSAAPPGSSQGPGASLPPSPPPVPPASQPLPQGAVLTDLGAPPGGLPVISDLVVFDDRLFLLESLEPLGQFGAQVWTFDGARFQKVLDDPTSQGYLRGRVIGGALFVPDGDPNGLAPGLVHVFSSASLPPRTTVVEESVHNFDVVELNGEIYTSSGLISGESGLNRYDSATGLWPVVSRGPYSRLKYMAAYEGAIWSGKRPVGSLAELVRIDPATGLQQGVDLTAGVESAALCLETIGPYVYCTLGSGQGIVHVRLEPGGTVTQLTGTGGALLYDYAEHSDGNVYAVGTDLASRSFVYGSRDGVAFTRLIEVADLRFGRLASTNLDGRPSIASYQGALYCGGSRTGRLYRVD